MTYTDCLIAVGPATRLAPAERSKRPEGVDVSHKIETICLASVNSYLVAANTGFALIDTGKPEKRSDLDARLSSAGCKPGDLRLIVLTHGDYDHAGNAAFLREKHGATTPCTRTTLAASSRATGPLA